MARPLGRRVGFHWRKHGGRTEQTSLVVDVPPPSPADLDCGSARDLGGCPVDFVQHRPGDLVVMDGIGVLALTARLEQSGRYAADSCSKPPCTAWNGVPYVSRSVSSLLIQSPASTEPPVDVGLVTEGNFILRAEAAADAIHVVTYDEIEPGRCQVRYARIAPRR